MSLKSDCIFHFTVKQRSYLCQQVVNENRVQFTARECYLSPLFLAISSDTLRALLSQSLLMTLLHTLKRREKGYTQWVDFLCSEWKRQLPITVIGWEYSFLCIMLQIYSWIFTYKYGENQPYFQKGRTTCAECFFKAQTLVLWHWHLQVIKN